MLNYGGFGIPFGAAMLDFADDPRGFYQFVAIDDIAGVGAPPARGPKCGFRSPSVGSSLPSAFDCSWTARLDQIG
jgi:hypothetical protein